MADRPLVSLCMIVKNGGAALARCLASARGVADETIVVDTGSSDDSVSVARAGGATVVSHAWADDFAAARNAGLERARGDWILFLDCDEWFEPAKPVQLRELLYRPEYLGYFFRVGSELGRGERLESTILRLFRNSKRVRFRFPIHEQVLPDLQAIAAETGQRCAFVSDVAILHDGYTPAAMAEHGKVERNLRIFRKAVAQHPDEPYLWFKFADFLRGQAPHKAEALAAAERAFALVQSRASSPSERRHIPFWSDLLTVLCAARVEAGRHEEALALLVDEPPSELAAPSYQYAAALALEAAGRIDEALTCIDACCGASRPDHATTWRPELVGKQGEALRAKLWLKKGDAAAALAASERSLAADRGFLAAIQLRAEALAASGEFGRALEFLMAELRRAPTERRLWQQAGMLLARIGRPIESRRCLSRAEAIVAS